MRLTREKALRLRTLIEKAVASLDDDDALEAVELFPYWEADVPYEAGVRLRYREDGNLYKVVQAHTSQADWTPDITKALYVNVAEPNTIPVWVQPIGGQDAYMTGDQVHYPTENDPVYESTIDNNVWSPEAYPAGWRLVE